jgi:hypothetical protein
MDETRVIHYRDRGQYDPARIVYIGRAMGWQRLRKSKWANLYKIGENGDRERCIDLYRRWLDHWLADTPGLTDELAALQGKVLMCWCRPDPCHGDVLAEYAERLAAERRTDG